MSNEIKEPTTLSECFKQLDKIFENSEDGDWFKSAEERDAIVQSHHGLGQWIRNKWNLWEEESTLYQYFKKLGLHHPDDMSSVILTSYHRHINENEIELDSQIKKYIEFWKNNK